MQIIYVQVLNANCQMENLVIDLVALHYDMQDDKNTSAPLLRILPINSCKSSLNAVLLYAKHIFTHHYHLHPSLYVDNDVHITTLIC